MIFRALYYYNTKTFNMQVKNRKKDYDIQKLGHYYINFILLKNKTINGK